METRVPWILDLIGKKLCLKKKMKLRQGKRYLKYSETFVDLL